MHRGECRRFFDGYLFYLAKNWAPYFYSIGWPILGSLFLFYWMAYFALHHGDCWRFFEGDLFDLAKNRATCFFLMME